MVSVVLFVQPTVFCRKSVAARPVQSGCRHRQSITLHAARVAVYESVGNQAAHWMQSLDRIHRRGQERPVEYLTLLCRDTIETPAHQLLVEKSRRQATLLGDTEPAPYTRQALMTELSMTVPEAPS